MPIRGKLSKRLKADMPAADILKKRVAETPTGPGIYRWMDSEGTVLYVGKAKNLRKRLQSYIRPAKASAGPWKQAFFRAVTDFDVTVCNSELEALVLETNLIKQLKPKFNVLMKDDKHYLYIRITVQDPFPRIETVRRMGDDGAKYFGPMTSGLDVRQLLLMLRKIYPYRTCRMEIEPVDSGQKSVVSTDHSSLATDHIHLEVICRNKDRPTPCLDHHIGQCSAPCIGTKTPEEYRAESIDGVIRFLKGDEAEVKSLLQQRMGSLVAERKFEQAAAIRDDLRLIERGTGDQLASDTTREDTDIVGVALLAGRAHVVVMQRRNGKLIGDYAFALAGQPESAEEVLDEFLPQYYADTVDIPSAILVGIDIPDRAVLEEWLSMKRGGKVQLKVPERGRKSHLLQLAEKNALERAHLEEIKWEADRKNTEGALWELQETLSLPALPKRIEAYDISHLGGTETVGSMVVAIDGKPQSAQYRSFTLRTIGEGEVDDYRSLQEVLTRRLKYLLFDPAAEEKRWQEKGITFGKARKAEQAAIERVFDDHPQDFLVREIDYHDFLVARHEQEIVAFGRLCHHSGNIVELKSVWVAEAWQGERLGQVLVRKLLRSVKKGKVYTTIPPELESYYGELGFRYIHEPPAPLRKIIEEREKKLDQHPPGLVMMWDVHQNKLDTSFFSRPDLLVIDGGKGQLSSALEVLQKMKIDIPVIGLAKREEEVFIPGKSDPVTFPQDAPAKFLLMRLRDEAHRFANRHRTARHKKQATTSALDAIPGIGPVTKHLLFQKFGSLSGIRAASEADLRLLLTEAQLEKLKQHL